MLVASPNGERLEELVTLSRDLASALLQVPTEGKLKVAEWPVSPGERRTVTLVRHDVYAPGARIVKVVPEGEIEVPRSGWIFFWGGDDEGTSRIVVSLDPENSSLRAMTISDEGVNELTPPPAASRQHRLATPAAEALQPTWTCEEETLPPTPPASARTPASAFVRPEALAGFTKSAVVAIDTDNEFMQKKFGDNTTNAVNYIASLFAQMNVIYERDVSLHLLEGYTILRVSSVPDPYVQSSTGNADGAKLTEFGNYWSAHYGAVKRTLAAMLSGKQGSSNSASGIAWIGGLCSSGYGYSFNQVFQVDYLAGDTQIVGHEIGHNFGSPHTHCYSPPADMCWNTESGCYSGSTSCPPPQTINGVPNVTGTLMSYCHLLAGCSAFLVFHPRTITEYFNSNITSASACIFNVGSLPPGPTVTAISPPTGSPSGGTAVTLTGSNFSAGAKVAFVDLSSSVTLTVGTVNAGSISATTPSHVAGTMDVVVMNSDYQTGTLRNGFTYTSVVPPPTVSTISPSFGSTAGGTLLTITGANFQNGASVTVGNSAAGVIVVNSTTITATTASHAAGTVDIVVTNPDAQTGTLTGGFSYGSGIGFFTLTPCRLIDTRNANGLLSGPSLVAQANRTFVLTGQCGIPSSAKAVSVNVVAVLPTAGPGFLTVFPAGVSRPVMATINYNLGKIRANNAILPLGALGNVTVFCGQGAGTVDLVMDVNGYFQ